MEKHHLKHLYLNVFNRVSMHQKMWTTLGLPKKLILEMGGRRFDQQKWRYNGDIMGYQPSSKNREAKPDS